MTYATIKTGKPTVYPSPLKESFEVKNNDVCNVTETAQVEQRVVYNPNHIQRLPKGADLESLKRQIPQDDRQARFNFNFTVLLERLQPAELRKTFKLDLDNPEVWSKDSIADYGLGYVMPIKEQMSKHKGLAPSGFDCLFLYQRTDGQNDSRYHGPLSPEEFDLFLQGYTEFFQKFSGKEDKFVSAAATLLGELQSQSWVDSRFPNAWNQLFNKGSRTVKRIDGSPTLYNLAGLFKKILQTPGIVLYVTQKTETKVYDPVNMADVLAA